MVESVTDCATRELPPLPSQDLTTNPPWRPAKRLYASRGCQSGAYSAVGSGSSSAVPPTSDDAEYTSEYENFIPELLAHYEALEINEELQLGEETQRDMGDMWILGSRACASQLASSKFTMILVSTVISVDILVSINLEPNPPPGQPKSDFEYFALVLDIVATTIFTLEAFVRIHAMTFSGYLSSGFNKLDLLVVLTSWPAIFVESFGVDLGPLRAFRVMRALKKVCGSESACRHVGVIACCF